MEAGFILDPTWKIQSILTGKSWGGKNLKAVACIVSKEQRVLWSAHNGCLCSAHSVLSWTKTNEVRPPLFRVDLHIQLASSRSSRIGLPRDLSSR